VGDVGAGPRKVWNMVMCLREIAMLAWD
jgi:hypothetical protein